MVNMIIIYREKNLVNCSTLSENIIYISYGSKDEISVYMYIFSFNNHINSFIRHKVVLKSHGFHFKNSGDSN